MSSYRDDYEKLVAHWDGAFKMTDDEMAEAAAEHPQDPSELAPSLKLFEAARALGSRRNVLDYGCGNGWASVIIARSGCEKVACADPSPNALKAAGFMAKLFGVEERVDPVLIDENWLAGVPAGSYDGLFCSNVLDVVPPEMADEIIGNAARAVADNAPVTVGLNFYMSPERAAERGLELTEDGRLYVGGVLRMVSRTDEDWAERLGRYFDIVKLEHFAWPGEENETRRLFFLRKRAKGERGVFTFIDLRERPELMDSAAEWFHGKWGVPKEAYVGCMTEYIEGRTELGWYLCLEGERIVGGLGVIENDFHDRKDLAPNICAVYTEPDCRRRGIAGRLLDMAVEELRAKGVSPVYLLTDHTGFYERYGWEFYCMAQGDGEEEPSRLYVHR